MSAARRSKALSDRLPLRSVQAYVTAREPKLNEIVLRPSNLFVTVDYDRSLIPGVIVMALFMGSMTSGVFNWIMDRFSGVTEAYLVTPLSVWNIAGGILASSVLATTCEAIVVLIMGLVITGGGIAGGLKRMGVLCGVIALTGTGLLAMMFAIYSRASNPRLIGGPAGFLNVILFFPSGAIYPVESLPHWLRAFTRWNPETHAVSALKSIMFKGAHFAAISGDVAVPGGVHRGDASAGRRHAETVAINFRARLLTRRTGESKLRISFNFNVAAVRRIESRAGSWEQTMILCQCKGVTDAAIKKLIEEGASTLQAIVKTCGAGRRCPPCRAEISAMLCRDTASARYDAASGAACAA